MPADTPPVQDHELPSGPARGAPLSGKDRSDAVVLLLRTRQTRLFFQIAPCLAPRNLLLRVKAREWLLYSLNRKIFVINHPCNDLRVGKTNPQRNCQQERPMKSVKNILLEASTFLLAGG